LHVRRQLGGVRHTTGGKFNEDFGERDFGQPPHVFKVVSDKTKELQSDKEPYWRWEFKCGARAMRHDLIQIPMQVLVTAYETGALVDLPLTYLAPVIEHHFD
jgi:hypothetical protein